MTLEHVTTMLFRSKVLLAGRRLRFYSILDCPILGNEIFLPVEFDANLIDVSKGGDQRNVFQVSLFPPLLLRQVFLRMFERKQKFSSVAVKDRAHQSMTPNGFLFCNSFWTKRGVVKHVRGSLIAHELLAFAYKRYYFFGHRVEILSLDESNCMLLLVIFNLSI